MTSSPPGRLWTVARAFCCGQERLTWMCWYLPGLFRSSAAPYSTEALTYRLAMPRVELYTTPTCSYCHAAKALLRRKGISFAEINVVGDPAHGRMTVPQIFIGPTHVGGFEELYALEQAGRLDALLAA